MRRIALAVLALGALAAPARAADPGLWTRTGATTLPSEYWQGLAAAPDGALAFVGPQVGAYRTSGDLLHETARIASVIPASVQSGERFNHIGDIESDPREGGRLLLPLECYYPYSMPGAPDPDNPCGYGAFGVADPVTLAWRYEVRLDPAEIPKAMWVALAPDGLLWTQAGHDLLAYSADAVNAANAFPAAPIHPVRRLAGAAPEAITGAAFLDGRLFVATQSGPMRMWSIDLATGARQLEVELPRVVGESEGLAAFGGVGGTLHWLIAPGTVSAPTFGRDTSALLHFVPRGTAPPGGVQQLSALKLRVTPAHPRGGRRVTLHVRASAVVVGRLRPAIGVELSARGATKAFTDDSGRAALVVRLPRRGVLVVHGRRGGYSSVAVRVRVRSARVR